VNSARTVCVVLCLAAIADCRQGVHVRRRWVGCIHRAGSAARLTLCAREQVAMGGGACGAASQRMRWLSRRIPKRTDVVWQIGSKGSYRRSE
jgi:hypothetical protein